QPAADRAALPPRDRRGRFAHGIRWRTAYQGVPAAAGGIPARRQQGTLSRLNPDALGNGWRPTDPDVIPGRARCTARMATRDARSGRGASVRCGATSTGAVHFQRLRTRAEPQRARAIVERGHDLAVLELDGGMAAVADQERYRVLRGAGMV